MALIVTVYRQTRYRKRSLFSFLCVRVDMRQIVPPVNTVFALVMREGFYSMGELCKTSNCERIAYTLPNMGFSTI